jgi:hypothetical protein
MNSLFDILLFLGVMGFFSIIAFILLREFVRLGKK